MKLGTGETFIPMSDFKIQRFWRSFLKLDHFVMVTAKIYLMKKIKSAKSKITFIWEIDIKDQEYIVNFFKLVIVQKLDFKKIFMGKKSSNF